MEEQSPRIQCCLRPLLSKELVDPLMLQQVLKVLLLGNGAQFQSRTSEDAPKGFNFLLSMSREVPCLHTTRYSRVPSHMTTDDLETSATQKHLPMPCKLQADSSSKKWRRACKDEAALDGDKIWGELRIKMWYCQLSAAQSLQWLAQFSMCYLEEIKHISRQYSSNSSNTKLDPLFIKSTRNSKTPDSWSSHDNSQAWMKSKMAQQWKWCKIGAMWEQDHLKLALRALKSGRGPSVMKMSSKVLRNFIRRERNARTGRAQAAWLKWHHWSSARSVEVRT